jgi:hypothetical protein
MGLKTEDNSYMHNLLFGYDEAVITRYVGNVNYAGRKQEYKKWGLNINYDETKCLGTDHSEKFQIKCKRV